MKGTSTGKVKNKVFTGKVFCGHCGEEYRPYGSRWKLPIGEIMIEDYLICQRRRLPSSYDYSCFNAKLKRDEFRLNTIRNGL